jgi:hypothetical protein
MVPDNSFRKEAQRELAVLRALEDQARSRLDHSLRVNYRGNFSKNIPLLLMHLSALSHLIEERESQHEGVRAPALSPDGRELLNEAIRNPESLLPNDIDYFDSSVAACGSRTSSAKEGEGRPIPLTLISHTRAVHRG